MSDEREWRVKYREALARLEAEETRANQLHDLLRILICRLCLAAEGRNPRLDQELTRVSSTVRKNFDLAELEKLIEPLSQAVAALDSSNQAAAMATAVANPSAPQTGETEKAPVAARANNAAADAGDGDSGNAASLSLLDRVALLPELHELVNELRGRGQESLSVRDLVELLQRLTRVASEQRVQVQRERLELEDLVQQMTARLDEIETHLAGELAERTAVQDDTMNLEVLVSGEVEEIRGSVLHATDLLELRKQLNARLNTVASLVKDFRSREETRAGTYRERVHRMRARISALERESRNLHQSLKEGQKLAMIDALTGIPNRAAYDDRIEQEFKRWKRFGRPVSILAWDIDRFKSINDAYGHKAGDKVLRIVGQLLVRHVRDTDFVARYGGEEFVMLLVGSSVEEGKDVAEKIRGEIAALGFHFHDQPVTVTASCGITAFAGDENADSAFDRADKALYKAKKAGRNCCVAG